MLDSRKRTTVKEIKKEINELKGYEEYFTEMEKYVSESNPEFMKELTERTNGNKYGMLGIIITLREELENLIDNAIIQ